MGQCDQWTLFSAHLVSSFANKRPKENSSKGIWGIYKETSFFSEFPLVSPLQSLDFNTILPPTLRSMIIYNHQNEVISLEAWEVKSALRTVKQRKAAGNDCKAPEILRIDIETAAIQLKKLFDEIWEKGESRSGRSCQISKEKETF
ncbi:hypothetical protein CEXT_584301 [Caerostris extrusa]|uniref:Uncharacterized protein n=1 Tax=Caerostris extrusa TaxID=172846 RepID=A0AAV4N357_CAEEX|nr:hypothetical protein CEXT_584301 [Caerostris extrusa]